MSIIPRPAHPSPDRVRENWENLNGTWQFSFEEDKFDREITVPFSWTAPLSGIGENKDGIGYYRKYVKKNKGGERMFIVFGAVDYYCTLYVNGCDVGSHTGGYARFEFDVTKFWKDDFENEIVLIAEDTSEKYQTYGKQGYGNSRGIWQTVYLELRPQNYIDTFRIVTKIDGTITIDCNLVCDKPYTLTASFDGYEATAENENSLTLNITDPKLWTCETPYLYRGTLSLKTSSGTDNISTYFGIREVGTARFDEDGNKFITLNGKPIYINGVLDQSYNPEGHFTLPTDEECKNEILRIKKTGLNLTRIHIKSEEPLKLYYADALGLLVMADIPCFWGNPTPLAKKLFEEQMYECMARDINHPSIIYWVVFNESWGLITKENPSDKEGVYEKTTQEWVRRCYKAAKAFDPTRLVEDNSACRDDHIETDVNTWHFYRNGYEAVKETINKYADGSYEGSPVNYEAPNTCGDVVCMNSECGNYWGIEGNSGDSDIAWHYKYMLNQYRLHPKMAGYIFTEFHDVINEFNGFYRIDNVEKVFGYDFYVPGMSTVDLHAQTAPVYDAPPMQTLSAGESVTIPVAVSCFELDRLNTKMSLRYELAIAKEDTFEITDSGKIEVVPTRISVNPAGDITVKMPDENAIAVLRLYLEDERGIVARTFVCFDVAAKTEAKQINVSDFENKSFKKAFTCQQGEKLNCLGAGEVSFEVSLGDLKDKDSLTLTFEASSRDTFEREKDDVIKSSTDLNLMLGAECKSGTNPNTFYMTDTNEHPGSLTVAAEGKTIGEFTMPDSPADSRGCLSWHYQANDRRLDEAGSFGYLYRCEIPGEVFSGKDKIKITFKADNGLSLFGRKSGRYAVGMNIK